MLVFDHFAIASEDLEDGTAQLEAALGLTLTPRGVHHFMGTHNRLLSLGPDAYLELIAIDPDGTAPAQPRWFDLDNFAGPARVTNWICRCADLEAALALAPKGIGTPWQMERNGLRWRMAVPEDGRLPFDGLFPALIEWEGTAHPAPHLPEEGIRLKTLSLESPEADALTDALSPLITDPRVQITSGPAPRIRALLETPRGEVTV